MPPPFFVGAAMNAILPPSLPAERVRQLLDASFGLEGDLSPLDGERDQNFRLKTQRSEFVVKVCNPAEGGNLAAAQVAALDHIAHTDPGLPVPRAIKTTCGDALAILDHGGKQHPVLVLGWLAGDVMGDEDYPADHYLALGRVVGRLTRALRGFVHPAFVDRKLMWNTAQFSPSPEDMAVLPQDAQDLVAPLQRHFVQTIGPALKGLPAQVIHGDVHPYNTLMDTAGTISGIIDFGDVIHGPRLLDLSNALADCLLPGQDVVKVLHAMTAGYVSQVPLESDEVELILPLVRMRLANTALITRMRRNEGAAITPQIAALDAASLDVLRSLDGPGLVQHVRYAAGHSVRRTVASPGLAQRRLAAMGPKPLLFYDEPLHIVKGEGVWLTADDGKTYLDCYNNVPHVGHAHPHVAEAVARQLRRLNTNTRYLTDEAIDYAERLKASLHPSLDTVIFVNSGSEANDVAWRMANVFTGKRGALCMDFAYHGVTMAADMLSPSNYPAGKWHAPLVRQLEAPDLYRGPLAPELSDVGDRYAAMAERAISGLEAAGHGLSISIIDSAFMTNGIINAPPGYVAGVVRRTREAGGLFIADEVQSGFGRMGTHQWGHQHHGVVPDVVTIGKPAGNGYPLGAIVTRAEILERFVSHTGPFFSTFGGGNAACAAGLAVLEVMEREQLLGNCRETGDFLRAGLRVLMAKHELIGDVRGSGLAIGVELVRSRASKEPAAAETRQIINQLKDHGVLVGSDGKLGNVLKIRPPIVFGPVHARTVIETLDLVLERMS